MLVLNSSQHLSAAVMVVVVVVVRVVAVVVVVVAIAAAAADLVSSNGVVVVVVETASSVAESPLNPEPLTLNLPTNSTSLLKGRLISGWIRGNVFLVLGGSLVKGGRD